VKTLLPGIITGAFAGEGAALILTDVTAAESPVLLLEPHADKQETSSTASRELMYLEVISQSNFNNSTFIVIAVKCIDHRKFNGGIQQQVLYECIDETWRNEDDRSA
jgi:hypothetical protein